MDDSNYTPYFQKKKSPFQKLIRIICLIPEEKAGENPKITTALSRFFEPPKKMLNDFNPQKSKTVCRVDQARCIIVSF